MNQVIIINVLQIKMKMKGIILNSEMVNTILETGVLEYRKAVKKHHPQGIHGVEYSLGDVKDKLFVKESFVEGFEMDGSEDYVIINDNEYDEGDLVPTFDYKANGFPGEWYENGEEVNVPWKPATNMRQSQSRLTVEITDIKVEKADVWEWVVNLKLIK